MRSYLYLFVYVTVFINLCTINFCLGLGHALVALTHLLKMILVSERRHYSMDHMLTTSRSIPLGAVEHLAQVGGGKEGLPLGKLCHQWLRLPLPTRRLLAK